MDISSIAAASSELSQMQVRETAGLLVLKKALDSQAQGALQLLQAVPSPAANPPHLGQGIDVRV